MVASFVHDQIRGKQVIQPNELTKSQQSLFNIDQAYKQMTYYIAVMSSVREVKQTFL